MKRPVIVWFRQDLRLSDNPALAAAAATGHPVLPLFVLDDESAGDDSMGAASRWWLHQSLHALNESLRGHLLIRNGDAYHVVTELARDTEAAGVFWNRCYEPWQMTRDSKIKTALHDSGRPADSFDGAVLFPPQSVSKNDGTPYRVFTPYFRKVCLDAMPAPRRPLPIPQFDCWHSGVFDGATINDVDALDLLPEIRWYDSIAANWMPGERGANEKLSTFLSQGIENYKEGRNRPDQAKVSRLSPHLHFGELSPHQAWHAAAHSDAPRSDVDHFKSELGWREFSMYLLYHFPDIPTRELSTEVQSLSVAG